MLSTGIPRLRPFYANVRSRILPTFSKIILTDFRLVKEAAIQSKEAGEKGLTSRSVKRATAVSRRGLCLKCIRSRV
jgi:hypothetical protein